MGHRSRDESAKNVHDLLGPRRRVPPAAEKNPVQEGFLSKEDLSNLFSVKPYLSSNGQMVINLLEGINQSGGHFDQNILTKLMGIFSGGNLNLAALGPLLAGLTGGGGKFDPSVLLPLLNKLGQARPLQEPAKEAEETENPDGE